MSPPTRDHHGPAPVRGTPALTRRLTLLLLIPAVVLTAVGMLLLWPHDTPDPTAQPDGPVQLLGEVRAVSPEPCPSVPEGEDQPVPGSPEPLCGTITVRLSSAPNAGSDITADIPNGPGAIRAATGDDVVLLKLRDAEGAGESYSILDYQRSRELWVLGAAFALAVIAFGRWRGLTALAGLALTFAVLLIFVVPAILDGRSPVMVAVVGAAGQRNTPLPARQATGEVRSAAPIAVHECDGFSPGDLSWWSKSGVRKRRTPLSRRGLDPGPAACDVAGGLTDPSALSRPPAPAVVRGVRRRRYRRGSPGACAPRPRQRQPRRRERPAVAAAAPARRHRQPSSRPASRDCGAGRRSGPPRYDW